MATLETRQFNYLAWLTGIVVLVYLVGSTWALVTSLITFQDFVTAIGVPGLPLIGWAARGAKQ